MARPLPRYTLPLAVVAVLAPVALGVATHLEHVASARPAIVIAPKEYVPIAVPTPIPAEMAPTIAPQPSAPPADTVEPPAAEPTAPTEPDLEAPEFFFTVRTAERTFVVLSQKVEDGWAASEPEALDAWGHAVLRDVAIEALPESLAAWQGQRIDTYGREGLPCPARIGTFRLLAQAHGDLSLEIEELEEGWDGFDEGEYEEIVRANAPTIWNVGRKLLVAEIDSQYACTGDAELALEHTGDDPLVYHPDRTRGAANFEPGRKAVFGTDRFQELAVEYDDYVEHVDPAMGVTVSRRTPLKRYSDATAWFTPDGEAHFVSVVVDGEIFGDCGGLPRPWGVTGVREGGDRVHGDAAAEEWGDVIAIVDLDRDGAPEILAKGWDRQLMRLAGGKLERLAELEAVPFFGCPC